MKGARILAAAIVLVAAALMIFQQAAAGMTLILGLACYEMGTAVILLIASRKIKVRLAVPKQAAAGEALAAVVEVETHRFLMLPQIAVFLCLSNPLATKEEKVSCCFPISFGAREQRNLEFSSKNCGCLKVAAERICFYDFFGILNISRNIAITEEIIVYPEQVDIFPRIDYEGAAEEDAPQLRQSRDAVDMTEIFGIREYRQGDHIKNIHWKLSAKMDEIMVKELGAPQEHQFLLVFETATAPEQESQIKDVDAAVSGFQALGSAFLRENCSFKIAWNEYLTGIFHIEEIQDENTFQQAVNRMMKELGKSREVLSPHSYMELLDSDKKNKMLYVTTLLPQELDQLAQSERRFHVLYASAERPVSQQGVISFSNEDMAQRLGRMVI